MKKRNRIWIYSLTVMGFVVILNNSCKKDDDVPVLTTSDLSDITQTTATCGGNITSDGGSAIKASGVCWSLDASPSIADNKTIVYNSIGKFTSALTGLAPDTKYYVRAYATNSAGTGYGSAISFKTQNVQVPVVTTSALSDIKQTTATCGGNIISNSGSEIIVLGVCWSIDTTPTIEESKTSDIIGYGGFTSAITGLSPNTMYYVRAYATNSAGTGYGNTISFITQVEQVPILTTSAITDITQTTATCGGNITSDEGATVTARGVCWGTNTTPTIADNKTIDGAGVGEFTSSITGLKKNTTYYVRAYATNIIGTGYANIVSFITGTVVDIDGNVYKTVNIGTQVWMKNNLKVTRYNNGDLIETTTPATVSLYCEDIFKFQWAYDGNESNVATYGRLYTWYAITDNRGVCPSGWHVPTDAEWTTLTDYLSYNGYGYDGNGDEIAKSMAAKSGWHTFARAGTVGNNQSSNDKSGFTALPGGSRSCFGEFYMIGEIGCWWSSTSISTYNALDRSLAYHSSIVYTDSPTKNYGISVRCLQDN
jgi:uncharacterized protein (TIGR02145 family)